MTNPSQGGSRKTSVEDIFRLYKLIYGPLGWTNEKIFREMNITDRSVMAAIEKRYQEREKRYQEREKLMAYCNGDSELLAAAYANFTAEQISAFVEEFL